MLELGTWFDLASILMEKKALMGIIVHHLVSSLIGVDYW